MPQPWHRNGLAPDDCATPRPFRRLPPNETRLTLPAHASPASPRPLVISINAAWNIVNFRLGLIAALQRRGFSVTALAPPDEHVDRLAAAGIPYVPIAMDKKGLSPAADLLLLARYWRLLRRLRPAAYLGYTAKPNVYGSIAAHLLGIPVINNVAGLGTAFIRPGPLAALLLWLYKRAFGRSATVFFQNPEDMTLFLERGIVKAKQAVLLPGSGIDLSRYTPRAPVPGSAEQGFTFLLVGRLIRDKGVGEFVEAARLVRARHPGARFQLLGFLDVENRTAVSRADVERWAAEGLIEYLGEAEDVRPHLAAADCIVLPSYREGMPRVLLEGAAMARPLIATDVPGCRTLVRDGENGLLCAVRDSGSLAGAMLRMIAMPAAARGALGATGRRIVEQEYDEGIVVERYLEAVTAAIGA